MKHTLSFAAAALLTAGAVHAGGIDRSGQGNSVLFETGDYAEFSMGLVNPAVSGTAISGLGGGSSGNMAPDYSMFGLSFKKQFSPKFAAAVIFDQPFGAAVAYPAALYPLTGTTANLDSTAITVYGKYNLTDRVSIFAGPRMQSMSGSVDLWQGGSSVYQLDVPSKSALGYSIGAAYEIPKIALRVALTYNSRIDYTFDTTEMGVVPGTMQTSTPESVNLDFQSGVAPDTLVFGSVRWVNWPQLDISPPNYPSNPLLSYDQATYSYTLGVGRKLSEHLAGSVSFGYEEAQGGAASNLAPTDGYKSISVGLKYTEGNMSISGGLRYVLLGDAVTETIGSTFSGNSALAVGIKVGFTF